MQILPYHKSEKPIFLLILTPLIYSVGFIFTDVFGGLSKVLSFIALIFFFYGFSKLKKNLIKKTTRQIVYLFVFYAIVSLLISLKISYDSIRGLILNPAFVLPFLCPLLIVKEFPIRTIKIISFVLALSSCLFILFSILNFSQFLGGISSREAIGLLKDDTISFDSISKNLAGGLGLGILLIQYQSKKISIIIALGFILNILIAIFLGRRNIIFTNSLYILFALYMFFKTKTVSKLCRRILYLFCGLGLIYFALNFKTLLAESENPLFVMLKSRIDLDSRGDVLDYYDKDMNSNIFYWIFGKGIDSQYYCPGVEETDYRKTVEAGWRHIILKVGLIGFLLYLLLLCPPIFKKKINHLTHLLGIYILIGIVELYPAGVPTFYLQYVLLWIAASIIYNPQNLILTNDQIKQLLYR